MPDFEKLKLNKNRVVSRLSMVVDKLVTQEPIGTDDPNSHYRRGLRHPRATPDMTRLESVLDAGHTALVGVSNLINRFRPGRTGNETPPDGVVLPFKKGDYLE